MNSVKFDNLLPLHVHSQDAYLSTIFSQLTSNNDEESKVRAAKALQAFVAAQLREMSVENFKRWLKALLKTHIWNFISSKTIHEQLGGLIAVDELIDVAHDDATSIIANYIRIGLKSSDASVMILAAKALGHLSRINSTITTECVEFDLHAALEWLQGERSEARRHAACLVLRELSTNTPTLFYGYVSTFIDLIWAALRDPKPIIRECAVEALGACLEVISERESKFRLQWYQKIFDEIQKGLASKFNSSADSIHASLLTIGELLRNTGDFLKDKFPDICQTVLRYKDNRDRLVKKAVISLIPRLAVFDPTRFVKDFLNDGVTVLFNALRKDIERPTTFIATGEVAVVVGKSMVPYLETCIASIKSALTVRNRGVFVYPEALICVSMLAKAVESDLLKYIKQEGLLDLMFAEGLSQTLTESLADISRHIPELSNEIRDKLLDIISVTLAQKPFTYPGFDYVKLRKTSSAPATPNPSIPAKEVDPEKNVALALNILGSFDFGSAFVLTEFLRECVVDYVNDTNLSVRKEAVVCCCKLMGGIVEQPQRHYQLIVSEVLEKLLALGTADPDASIRHSVLSSLDSRFDHHLAQASNLRSLFVALNDEIFGIRELSLIIICRISSFNPAHMMPSLRTTLIQLLTDLEHSGDNPTKEDSAKLLGHLIRAAPILVQPYVTSLMNVFLPKLRDADPIVASGVLSTIGELATVSGEHMIEYIHKLMPLIIDTLQDQSSTSKREVAMRTLGLLSESTGYVIAPYIKYPKLLDTILTEIQSETNGSIRKETIKVFGILGALDPYKHRQNELLLEGRQDDDVGTGKTQKTTETKEAEQLANLSPSNEDYYPSITIAALMRILRDSSLVQYHTLVIHALMVIVKALGMKIIQFLPQVMPTYLAAIRSSEPEFRALLFQQLGQVVSKVKQHIREYLNEIFPLIKEFWATPSSVVPIVTLVEEICNALGDEFRPYVPSLLPQLLNVLHNDPEPSHEATAKILRALSVFGTNLDDYLHLIIPAVVKLCEQNDPKIRIQALQTLSELCQNMNLGAFASRILHPLARVLDSTNPEQQKEAIKTICAVAKQLGHQFLVFVPTVSKILAKHHINNAEYDQIVLRIGDNQPIELELDKLPEINRRASDANAEDAPIDLTNVPRKIKLNEQNLRRAWEVSQRSTKEDWFEWLRNFSVVLLRESPSPALRACISLANDYHQLVKELFNAAFVSCWQELQEQYQDELVRSLETALQSPNIPLEILQTLLNLAEFMEQDEKPLPIDPRTLGQLAEKCNAYAKALHYKEMEFKTTPQNTLEALISINNQLQQPEAALGILTHAQKHQTSNNVELKESWYEKLQRWEVALSAYEKKQEEDPLNVDITLGRMRCLHALGEWEKLALLAQELWKTAQPALKQRIAPLAASSSWNLGNWDLMGNYVSALQENSVEGGFFRAVLAIHTEQYDKAQQLIDRTRELVDTKLTALVGESYNRAYKVVVRVQQLAELEEVIVFKKSPEKRNALLNIWNERLHGCERGIDTWKNITQVRSLVLSPLENVNSHLKFSSLCRKQGRIDLSNKTIVKLLGSDPAVTNALPTSNPRVTFAYIKQMWEGGAMKKAYQQLKNFVPIVKEDPLLQARMFLKLGDWQTSLEGIDDNTIPSVINSYHASIKYDNNWYKAWHSWALANYEAISFYEKSGQPQKRIAVHLVPAIKGFFRSIALAPESKNLQDTLRLLTVWFKHGALKDVESALSEGFNTVKIDTWLQVIPQLIARIHVPVVPIRRLITELLATIGKAHPQALVYPLTVASKSTLNPRVSAALGIIEKMKKHSATLVEQAQTVSGELIRVSILWHEMWHEGLEEASRTYFQDHNTEGMLAVLRPLHEMLEKGPETIREMSFHQAYARDLQDAFEWCKKWERSHKSNDLNQAWDLYYRVFRRINKQLPQLTSLEIQYVSPKLQSIKDLELAIPGTYRAGKPIIHIKSFNPSMTVITSKQRPRKIIINGSDGFEYLFLLKGHEDLRQDERVMQLFGLVNSLLDNEYETSKNHLNIQRYTVIPLSPNSGLLGWVPHSDTLHLLIKDFRDARKIPINIEHKLMLQMAPDYDNLTLMQKVEAFEFALDSTNGLDLERILWLKSSNSEAWLDRRTNYTRSLAVMSMVGYILGLGDRHPSNLMLDRHTGNIIHIDFGDCFEVAMHREKYPEKIPFRLTRMLINAMEVSGIEGTFRLTCENVMRVLRENKESLMAVLEAFVYDPIINWRLLAENSPDHNTLPSIMKTRSSDNNSAFSNVNANLPSSSSSHYFSEADLPNSDAVASENLNRKALQVINRVNKKLTGRDFGSDPLDISEQVQRLINQATSHENLCQCYIGWCPFW